MKGEQLMRRTIAVGAALGLVFPAALVAQAPVLAPAEEQIPYGVSGSVLADVDADGDLDLIGAPGAGEPFVLLNDGEGRFAANAGAASAAGSWTPFSAAAADFDGDGLTDLVRATFSSIEFRRGVAPGIFAALPSPFPSPALQGGFGSFSVAAGDVDLDGDLDVLIGQPSAGFGNSLQGQTRIVLNDGVGGFTDATAASGLMPGNVVARLIDVDGDGLLDAVGHYAVVTNPNPGLPLVIQRNLGSGVFGPLIVLPPSAPSSSGLCAVAPVAADLDGDGLVDFLVRGPTVTDVQWIRQVSTLTFVAQPPTPIGSRCLQGMAAIDLDGDGGREPVLVFDDAVEARPMAAGLIGPATAVLSQGGAALVGDVDQDGDADLVLADARGHRRVVYVDGAGGFAAPYGRMAAGAAKLNDIGMGWPAMQTTGDFDGDGDLDVAGLVGVAPAQPSSLRLAWNDGEGRFASSLAATVTGLPTNVDCGLVAAFDADADGDTDLLYNGHFYGIGAVEQYYLVQNQGGGVFAAAPGLLPNGFMPVNAFNGTAAVADFDQDGDPDLVVVSRGPNLIGSRLWFLANDGFGGFAHAVQIAAGNAAARLGAGDLDADGDADLVYFEGGNGGRTLLNQGAYTFVAGPNFTAAAVGTVLRVADFDGDGAVEVFNGAGYWRLLGGVMTYTDVFAGNYPSQAVSLADVNADGSTDVFLDVTGRWLLNDGLGGFTDGGGAVNLQGSVPRPPLLGDFDRDGDVDAMNYDLLQFVNPLRGLEMIAALRSDATAHLRLTGAPNGSWILALSTPPLAAAATAVGLLALDPASIVPLGTGVSDAQGRADFLASLPAAAVAPFLGVPFVFQALVSDVGGAHLTNARTIAILDY